MDRGCEREGAYDAVRQEWGAWLGDPTPALDFRAIHQEHASFVWSCLRRAGVPSAVLDDAAQDVFLTAYRALPRYTPHASIRAWLAGISRKIAFRYRRTGARVSRKMEALSHVWPSGSPSRDLDDRLAVRQTLARALAELDEDRRLIFVLADLHGLSGKELAQALDLRPTTVDARLRSARERVREAFRRSYVGSESASATREEQEAQALQAALQATRDEEAPPTGWIARSWLLLVPKLPLAGVVAQMLAQQPTSTLATATAPWRSVLATVAFGTLIFSWPGDSGQPDVAARPPVVGTRPEFSWKIADLEPAIAADASVGDSGSPSGDAVGAPKETDEAQEAVLQTGWRERLADNAGGVVTALIPAIGTLGESLAEADRALEHAPLHPVGVRESEAVHGTFTSVPNTGRALAAPLSRGARAPVSPALPASSASPVRPATVQNQEPANKPSVNEVNPEVSPERATVYVAELRDVALLKDKPLVQRCLQQAVGHTSLVVATESMVSRIDAENVSSSIAADLTDIMPQLGQLEHAFATRLEAGEFFAGQWRTSATGAVGWMYGLLEDGVLLDLKRVDDETMQAWSQDAKQVAVVSSDSQGVVSRILDQNSDPKDGHRQVRVHGPAGGGQWLASRGGPGFLDEHGWVDASFTIPGHAAARRGDLSWMWIEEQPGQPRMHLAGPGGDHEIRLPAHQGAGKPQYYWLASNEKGVVVAKSAQLEDNYKSPPELFHIDLATAKVSSVATPADWQPTTEIHDFPWLVTNRFLVGVLLTPSTGEKALWTHDLHTLAWSRIALELTSDLKSLAVTDLDGAWAVHTQRIWQEEGKLVLHNESALDVILQQSGQVLHRADEARMVAGIPGTSCAVIGGVAPGRLVPIGIDASKPAELINWASGEKADLGLVKMAAVLAPAAVESP